MNQECQTGTFGLRLEARLKNSKLVKAREQLRLTQQQVAEEIGIAPNSYCAYENLRGYPSIKTMFKMVSFYNRHGINLIIDEVFPEVLKHLDIPTKFIAEKEIAQNMILTMGSVGQKALKELSDQTTPLELLLADEIKENLRIYLSDLDDREIMILTLRYGLEGKPIETYRAVAYKLNISKERVRQIEKETLNKIYHLFKRDSNI